MNDEQRFEATAAAGEGRAMSVPPAPAAPPAPLASISAAAGAPAKSPAWFDCDLFCISDYAGVGGPRCGWRGRFEETRWDPTRRVRPCPRCGEATLLELEFTRSQFRE